MAAFMDENFLLQSEVAKRLYHDYAAKMPIIDYHCHINPADIAEDKQYTSISDVWLGGDHYKWRLMRANGSPESEITGARGKNDYQLFESFAKALPRAVGNHVYHWAHLELKRYFGIEKQLNMDTAREVYEACNARLAQPDMSVRGIISQSNVKLICTTDDPVDSLAWHRKIAADESCTVKVLPTFRPDRVANLENSGFAKYIAKLAAVSGVEIISFETLCNALEARIDFFHQMGCRAADHGMEYIPYQLADIGKVNGIFTKALQGEAVSGWQADAYRTALMVFVGRCYHSRGWVMQLHFGCMRNNNTRMLKQLGPDTGFDAMNGLGKPYNLACFLNTLEQTKQLPRTVLYSLNPGDSEIIASIASCFMTETDCPGKVQLGAAWWFNDCKTGIEKQLQDYANSTLLGNFVGMLTDSRSFLSYTRHEYFRRILCNFIGGLVENGEYPEEYDILGPLVEDICYYNTVRFFGFDV